MSAYEKPILNHSLLSAATFASSQYYAAKIDTAGKWALCTVAGEECQGIIQDPVASGIAAPVMVGGISKVKLGGTVTYKDRLAVDTSSKLVKAVGGDYCLGRALAAGVTGDIIPMLITHEGFVPVFEIAHVCDLAGITSASVDALTATLPAWQKFTIERWAAEVNVAATTGSKDASFQLKKNTTALLGTLALTSANCTPKGVVAATTAITETTAGDATCDLNDTLTIDAVTVSAAFAEGSVVFRIRGRLG